MIRKSSLVFLTGGIGLAAFILSLAFVSQPVSAKFWANVLFASVNQPLQNVKQVSAGGAQTCVVTTAGAVKCWGYNEQHSQLGDGSTNGHSTPETVLYAVVSSPLLRAPSRPVR
ncbi:MAG: RCC1 domain-containing protein [Caldilineaceae bacterium]